MGVMLGCASSDDLVRDSEYCASENVSKGTIVLDEDAKSSSFGATSTGRLLLEDGRTIKVGLEFPKADDEHIPLYGDVIQATFKLKDPGFATSSKWWNRGCAAHLNILSYERNETSLSGFVLPASAILRVRNTAIASFNQAFDGESQNNAIAAFFTDEPNALFSNQELSQTLSAIACGYKYGLSESAIYGSFKKCGLAHMMAVSGAHLMIVVALFNTLATPLSLNRRAIVAIDVSVMLGYLLLAGFPVSALRASLMTATAITSSFSKRRPSSVNALGICAVIIVVSDPFASLSLSFLLSFASTVGIVVFSPYVTYLLESAFKRLPNFLAEALSLTLSSNIVCLPISCSLFSQLPLIAVLSNIICGLMFPLFCALALLCGISFTILPIASDVLLFSATVIGKLFCTVVCVLARAPFSCVPIDVPEPIGFALTFAIPILFWIAWPKANTCTAIAFAALSMACALTFMLVGPATTGTRITMLDVGQGDAFLIQSESKTLLIDTGNHTSMLLQALGRNHVRKLDGILITHSDDDHMGSLKALSNSITIDSIFVAEGVLSCKDASCESLVQTSRSITNNVETLSPGNEINLGAFVIEDLWPNTVDEEWGNAESLCVYVTADTNNDGMQDCKALFCGDAETEQIETIIESYGIKDIDILKVAHHGSDTGTNDRIAQTLNPKVALISVGENNRYGHPRQSVIDELVNVHANVFRSDVSGDVSCKITADRINVTTQR